MYGSIAEQVVSQGSVPLLLVQPGSARFKLDRVLVPLDPDSHHDDSLPRAEWLGKSFGAELSLLSVIPTFASLSGEQAAAGTLMPTTAQAFLEIKAENALRDLNDHVTALNAGGVRASAQTARGDPAGAIVELSKATGADMILLSTHRKAGLEAFWARSVAPKVAKMAEIPLLLFPTSS